MSKSIASFVVLVLMLVLSGSVLGPESKLSYVHAQPEVLMALGVLSIVAMVIGMSLFIIFGSVFISSLIFVSSLAGALIVLTLITVEKDSKRLDDICLSMDEEVNAAQVRIAKDAMSSVERCIPPNEGWVKRCGFAEACISKSERKFLLKSSAAEENRP